MYHCSTSLVLSKRNVIYIYFLFSNLAITAYLPHMDTSTVGRYDILSYLGLLGCLD